MAQQPINVGTSDEDHTGDPVRVAFTKTNEMFAELYSSGSSGGATILTGNGAPDITLGNDGDYYTDSYNGVVYGPKLPVPPVDVLQQTPNGSLDGGKAYAAAYSIKIGRSDIVGIRYHVADIGQGTAWQIAVWNQSGDRAQAQYAAAPVVGWNEVLFDAVSTTDDWELWWFAVYNGWPNAKLSIIDPTNYPQTNYMVAGGGAWGDSINVMPENSFDPRQDTMPLITPIIQPKGGWATFGLPPLDGLMYARTGSGLWLQIPSTLVGNKVLRLPVIAAPLPDETADGDVWMQSDGLYFRIGGTIQKVTSVDASPLE